MNQFIFGDCQGNLCFILILRVFSRKEAQWTSLVGGSKQIQGWFLMVCRFLYCCRLVKMFFPSFPLRKFLRDVVSTPEFFFDYFAFLTNLSSGGVIRVYTKCDLFAWGCYNNNIIQITYFEKYEISKPALIISNYYRRYFPAYEWSKMEKCMG